MSLYLVAYRLSFKNKWDCKICNPTLENRFIVMLMVKLRPYSLIWMTRLLSCYWDVLYNSPGGSDGNASACSAGDLGSIPGSGRSAGEGNGNPLQYSCLENSMDGGAWWATVHGVAKSQTRLSDWQTHLNSHSVGRENKAKDDTRHHTWTVYIRTTTKR